MTYKKLFNYSIEKLKRIPSKLNVVDKMAIAGILLLMLAVGNNGGF